MLELTSGPPMRALVRALVTPARCVDRDEIAFRLEQSLRKPLAEAVPLAVVVRVRREGSDRLAVQGTLNVRASVARVRAIIRMLRPLVCAQRRALPRFLTPSTRATAAPCAPR